MNTFFLGLKIGGVGGIPEEVIRIRTITAEDLDQAKISWAKEIGYYYTAAWDPLMQQVLWFPIVEIQECILNRSIR